MGSKTFGGPEKVGGGEAGRGLELQQAALLGCICDGLCHMAASDLMF